MELKSVTDRVAQARKTFVSKRAIHKESVVDYNSIMRRIDVQMEMGKRMGSYDGKALAKLTGHLVGASSVRISTTTLASITRDVYDDWKAQRIRLKILDIVQPRK